MLRALPRLDDVSELLQAIKRDDDNCHKTYQAFSWHGTELLRLGVDRIKSLTSSRYSRHWYYGQTDIREAEGTATFG